MVTFFVMATGPVYDVAEGARFDTMEQAENRARFERHYHDVKIFKVVETHHYEQKEAYGGT